MCSGLYLPGDKRGDNMYNILIVEDEARIRTGLQRHIPWKQWGFQVVAEADNGKDALQKFNEFHPQVVLTDIRMDGTDGLTFMNEIRKRSEHAKIVVLSGYSDFEYARAAIQCGASAYLLKPTKTFELRQTFRKLRAELDQDSVVRSGAGFILPEDEAPLSKAIQYIYSHYDEKINLHTVAEQAFMSVSYFSKMFKQKVGKTFIEFLMDLRIEKAKRLLSSTDEKIISVSLAVGYDDFRYFCKIFKIKEHCSPKQYRKRYGK